MRGHILFGNGPSNSSHGWLPTYFTTNELALIELQFKQVIANVKAWKLASLHTKLQSQTRMEQSTTEKKTCKLVTIQVLSVKGNIRRGRGVILKKFSCLLLLSSFYMAKCIVRSPGITIDSKLIWFYLY